MIVPDDLRGALAANPKASQSFAAFAYSYRREYVQWIESAKRPETRRRRIAEAVSRIAKGTRFS
ncbi:MAG TPA: YdeI/OmpD-associated family protein [Candidatus Dormibacteraeota bacterium]|nr:YdeI/OmpD-associated family protein [Candidatus Dormibacteraeota bacterium]